MPEASCLGSHEIIHLAVFIDDVALETPDIEWLAPERERNLRRDAVTTRDGASGGPASNTQAYRCYWW